MLELRSRILLDNDEQCDLCGSRLPLGTEAHKGYIVDSQESRILCERCACIDGYVSDLDLSIETDLISVLCDIGYFKCECGGECDDLKFNIVDDSTVKVTCTKCGASKDCDVSLEALEDYFIDNMDKFNPIPEEDDEYEEYDKYADEYNYNKYTEDYIPDTDVISD